MRIVKIVDELLLLGIICIEFLFYSWLVVGDRIELCFAKVDLAR